MKVLANLMALDLRSDLAEMLEWVRETVAEDPDAQSRELAMTCLVLLQEASKKAMNVH